MTPIKETFDDIDWSIKVPLICNECCHKIVSVSLQQIHDGIFPLCSDTCRFNLYERMISVHHDKLITKSLEEIGWFDS